MIKLFKYDPLRKERLVRYLTYRQVPHEFAQCLSSKRVSRHSKRRVKYKKDLFPGFIFVQTDTLVLADYRRLDLLSLRVRSPIELRDEATLIQFLLNCFDCEKIQAEKPQIELQGPVLTDEEKRDTELDFLLKDLDPDSYTKECSDDSITITFANGFKFKKLFT